MKRPKNFLFLALSLSVVAVVLAVAVHTAREPRPAGRQPTASEAVLRAVSPTPAPERVGSEGTPSAAARKRAKEFNDATNRFNAPDDQPR